MSLADTAKMIAELALDDRKFQAGAKRTLGTLGQLEKGTSRIGKGAGQLSAGLARSGAILGGAVVTGLTGAAKAAIDFQDAFQGVVKTVDPKQLADAGLTFDDLATSIRKMATEIPVAATELSGIAAEAGALGVAGKDIIGFTKVVAELGVTTNLSSADAAEALGHMGTILHLTGKDFEDFADVLVNLGNNGASTEADIIGIAERFAAAGKQAGLATPQILALSSAASSVGIDVEAAGGSLSRLFNSMSTNIALANKKGVGFAKVTGKSIKELKKEINDGKGFEVFQSFLKGLQGLSKTDFAQALKNAGITNVRDVNAIQLMAQNMGFFADQVDIATKSTGALGKEAGLRFDTIKSKLTLLKNGVVEAGIEVGEGFLPALGRAATKLSAFLAQDGNKSRLKKLGEDIGKAIDGIDWQKVLDGAEQFIGYLKIAFDYAKRIFDAVNALPTEIKAAGIAFIGLNKLSGGLIGAGLGNIFGGLAESIGRSVAASIPVIGKAFVQPVFVTNMPGGGLGGGVPGAAGGVAKTGIGTLGKLFLIGEAIGLIAAVNEVRNSISDDNTRRSEEIKNQTRDFIASQPDKQALTRGLDGVQTGIRDLQSNPLLVLVQGEALDNLKEMRLKLAASLAENRDKLGDSPGTPSKPKPGTVGRGEGPAGRREFNRSQATLSKKITDVRDKVESAKIAQVKALVDARAGIRDKIEAAKIAGVAASDRVRAAADTVRDRVESAKIAQVSATNAGSSNIVSAIHGIPPPTVKVYNDVRVSATNVTKVNTVINRYGKPGGSKNMPAHRPG